MGGFEEYVYFKGWKGGVVNVYFLLVEVFLVWGIGLDVGDGKDWVEGGFFGWWDGFW